MDPCDQLREFQRAFLWVISTLFFPGRCRGSRIPSRDLAPRTGGSTLHASWSPPVRFSAVR
jgi:hypothetical protein